MDADAIGESRGSAGDEKEGSPPGDTAPEKQAKVGKKKQ